MRPALALALVLALAPALGTALLQQLLLLLEQVSDSRLLALLVLTQLVPNILAPDLARPQRQYPL
jgi:uncharacterized protein YejL (UPF0352 family)